MNELLTLFLIVGGTMALSWPLGKFITWAMEPKEMTGFRAKLEKLFASIAGQSSREQQNWKRYCLTMLGFNAIIFVVAFLFLFLQQHLPLNPDSKGALKWDLIFNTTASFVTNTNLQHYSGEVSMSYFSQLFALMWLQFVTPAVGLACLAALARELRGRKTMGNFFIDLQRATFLVMLPIAFLFAILYVLGGTPMTLQGSAIATTLEGIQQTIARGPVAAFVAIKQIGTNGGGFFGPNSTHPFENVSFFTNLVSMVAILLIPMACVWMFGHITERMKHAAIIFGVMLFLLLGKFGLAWYFESAPTAALHNLPIDQTVGNLEGKELRLGAITGPLWAALTTCTSNGSVGAMHNSLNPLTGLAPLVGMWLNETFGGVGVGMINMFVYVILAVFLAGMMVGRTPEYFQRRVETREVTLAVIALLVHSLLILGCSAIFAVTPWGVDTIKNHGARGLTEILYEFTSSAANNGSGYEGLSDNTVPWNIATGLVMLIARYVPIILPLAIAGMLAAKKQQAESAGTLPTHNFTFAVMLVSTLLFLGALTFFPVAVLGPIVEHLALMKL